MYIHVYFIYIQFTRSPVLLSFFHSRRIASKHSATTVFPGRFFVLLARYTRIISSRPRARNTIISQPKTRAYPPAKLTRSHQSTGATRTCHTRIRARAHIHTRCSRAPSPRRVQLPLRIPSRVVSCSIYTQLTRHTSTYTARTFVVNFTRPSRLPNHSRVHPHRSCSRVPQQKKTPRPRRNRPRSSLLVQSCRSVL